LVLTQGHLEEKKIFLRRIPKGIPLLEYNYYLLYVKIIALTIENNVVVHFGFSYLIKSIKKLE
jgi:hypothetical protein